MPHFRISEAAELLGISDDTVRRWIDTGRIAARTDDTGRQVIEGADLAAFAQDVARAVDDPRSSAVSARNRFVGLVTDLQIEGLVAQVEIQAGPHRIVSLITADSARALGLEVGSRAVATVKATNVGVEVET